MPEPRKVKKRMEKAQTLVLGTVVIIVLAVVVISLVTQQVEILTDEPVEGVQEGAERVAQVLLSKRSVPNEWWKEPSTVKKPNLMKDDVLSMILMDSYTEIPYDQTKLMLGMGEYEYIVTIQDPDGNLIPFGVNSFEVLGWNARLTPGTSSAFGTGNGAKQFIVVNKLMQNLAENIGVYKEPVVLSTGGTANLVVYAWNKKGVPDTNENGIPDTWEEEHGITDIDADDDGDGLKNFEEFIVGTDPQEPDTDGDCTIDGVEVDTGTLFINSNPLDWTDGMIDLNVNGLPDCWENEFIPLVCGDGRLSFGEECDDGCMAGVPNVCEVVDDLDGCSSGCILENPPACGNGVVDAGEQCDDGCDWGVPGVCEDGDNLDGCSQFCQDETTPDNVCFGCDVATVIDCDYDGLSNAEEMNAGTDPCDSDTDGDGFNDGGEIYYYGTDPIDPMSFSFSQNTKGTSSCDDVSIGAHVAENEESYCKKKCDSGTSCSGVGGDSNCPGTCSFNCCDCMALSANTDACGDGLTCALYKEECDSDAAPCIIKYGAGATCSGSCKCVPPDGWCEAQPAQESETTGYALVCCDDNGDCKPPPGYECNLGNPQCNEATGGKCGACEWNGNGPYLVRDYIWEFYPEDPIIGTKVNLVTFDAGGGPPPPTAVEMDIGSQIGIRFNPSESLDSLSVSAQTGPQAMDNSDDGMGFVVLFTSSAPTTVRLFLVYDGGQPSPGSIDFAVDGDTLERFEVSTDFSMPPIFNFEELEIVASAPGEVDIKAMYFG